MNTDAYLFPRGVEPFFGAYTPCDDGYVTMERGGGRGGLQGGVGAPCPLPPLPPGGELARGGGRGLKTAGVGRL